MVGKSIRLKTNVDTIMWSCFLRKVSM